VRGISPNVREGSVIRTVLDIRGIARLGHAGVSYMLLDTKETKETIEAFAARITDDFVKAAALAGISIVRSDIEVEVLVPPSFLIANPFGRRVCTLTSRVVCSMPSAAGV
jgi:hypothetical protein